MSNTFGTLFRITTWGESHGTEIGVVIDGCPSGIVFDYKRVQEALTLRRPGSGKYVSPRDESDQVIVVSGIYEGKTTGAPICLKIANTDAKSSEYKKIKNVLRPGHANYTWLKKYGVFDPRGGGRASGRETACRVAAGAVAQMVLDTEGVKVSANLISAGGIEGEALWDAIEHAKDEGDSLGGVVELRAIGVPVGWGEPIYDKIQAKLGHGILSIPATKGIEFGKGFKSAQMKGSEHNDTFQTNSNKISLTTNHSGGVLGGLSNGEDIICRVAFKPTSTICKMQQTVDCDGNQVSIAIGQDGRHDPCIAVRGAYVVKAMAQLVLTDLLLLQKSRCNIFPSRLFQEV